tara:strand:- start:363 stop:1226 length:864 start_codon:yes stop_codon:yes gene_type:complete
MATVNLGRLKPVFKGAYNSSTAYVIDDIVTYANETYINIQAGTNQQPNTATGYWTKLAAKGSDGTDVGATLTTQGDILYRDGSGLQRLGYGTAGQVLQTGGSGANPSWGSVSSDYVRIANSNLTSGTKASFDNVFSTSDGYQSYKCKIHGFRPSTGQWLKFKWRSSGSDLTDNYTWRVDGFRRKADNSASQDVYDYDGYSYGALTFWSQRNDGMGQVDIDFGNPAIASINGHTWKSTATTYEADNGIVLQNIMGCRENTAAYDGFCVEISNTSNSFTQLDVSVYGLK